MASLPPLSALRVFEAAARHENFSQAADELAMTQAAVSHQIKALGEHLGGPLFIRRDRKMMLTDLGRSIAPDVLSAFARLRETFTRVRVQNDTILTITAPRTFATNWLAGRLGDFHSDRPDLAVRLDVTDTLVDLTSGEFDAAIRGMSGPTPGLVAHFLMPITMTPLASPAFLAAHALREPADLFKVPRLSPKDEWWNLWFGEVSERETDLPSQRAIGFESQVLDGHSAIAGHGVAMLSPPMFQPALASGLLVQPFAHVAAYKFSYWLAYPEHTRNLPKIRAFRDWILGAVQRGGEGT